MKATPDDNSLDKGEVESDELSYSREPLALANLAQIQLMEHPSIRLPDDMVEMISSNRTLASLRPAAL